MEYYLKSNELEVTISTLGAEMISVKYYSKERLWQNDNNTWSGHAPVLFPIAGKIKVKIDGITYPLLQHGFARRREFEFVSRSDNKITFKLSSDEETLKLFPYHFDLYISYEINDSEIKLIYEVKNTGDNTMYYSLGTHTSFSLDETIDNYNVVFDSDKELINHLNDRDPSLIGDTIKMSDEGILDLSTEYIENAKTVIFKNLKSTCATLIHKSGRKIASIEYDGFPYILFWHPLDSKMVCMEPWHNILDYKDDDREFKDKDGIIKLEKNESKVLSQTIRYY